LRLQGLQQGERSECEGNISTRLLKFRLECGITQEQMGVLIDATQSQVSMWENSDIKMSKMREKHLSDYLDQATAK
jgi:transcriptional regulator with XRE-family HTH domain